MATALLVVSLLGAAWYFWGKQKSADAEGGYRTEAVQRGDIRVAISATGTLSAISTVTVGSQISGLVTDVLVDFNSPVRKDQVLATIDPSTYQAQIEQGSAQIASARAQLAQAQASLRNAQLDYQRKSDLGRQQLIARSDLDQSRAALDQAQAQVNSAQAQIRQQTASTQTTRVNLQRTVIRSPVDGVVLTRKIEPGQTVAASFSAPELFTIAEDLSKMKIELAVDESDIGQVKVGQAVNFTADAFPDRQFKGVVDQVRLSATTASNVVTYPVVVTVDNADGTLLPGLTVNAEIEVSKRTGVLKVANAALRYKPAETGAAPAQAPQGARGAGSMAEDLQASAQALGLDERQQAALQQALDDMRQRQAGAAQATAQNGQQGGSRLFGGGTGGPRMVVMGGGAGNSGMMAQVRQRMRERMQQQFAGFRATLDDAQRAKWDAAVDGLLNAKRAPVYKLVDGKPDMAMVRIGASDGTTTEISGNIKEGDLLVAGERAAEAK
ncbi:MAG: efflux RND transporter periplasmic adaptor subunit [Thermomonas sp.]|nr:efflux RND transporter periplasmic adaptor subunit [Thermomonas sp.]